ncbi:MULTISPECIES: SHOCT domain-containing protein [Microbacteriaceae]|uniref:SHOCT domain-containing protein n=1 Tax=Orlajensenia leifsoniae TaxID=2561933 RepID=A0A4Y9R6A9_9MICO|nr:MULTISPECIES: SHOCT domain-containing protein [Leifsonia]KQQ95306.1 hypothetical protein ASF62_01840 [Leifsonia sp. Leaf325]TFV99066.1 SHOCT domain-containing protein [Leifsonia flava]
MTIWDFFVWFFWFYIAVACIVIFIRIIVDLFQDKELNGWAKALWVIFLILAPFLAALIYLVARGQAMAQRSAARAQQASEASNEYIRSVAGSPSSAASEIEAGKKLLDSGAITPAEYEQLKAKSLASA